MESMTRKLADSVGCGMAAFGLPET